MSQETREQVINKREHMERDEWLKRYKQRFMDCIRTETMDPKGIEELADDCAHAVSFEEASDGYEDDPEGAADEEMSYWEP